MAVRPSGTMDDEEAPCGGTIVQVRRPIRYFQQEGDLYPRGTQGYFCGCIKSHVVRSSDGSLVVQRRRRGA